MRNSFLLLMTALFAATGTADAGDVRKFSAQGIKSLVLTNSQGNVSIEGWSGGDHFEIRFDAFTDPVHCDIKTETRAGELTVTAGPQQKLAAREKCRTNITVKAPRQLNLDVRLGTGSLTATGLLGSVRFNVGSGDTVLTGIQAPELTGRTGSGDVRLTGMVATADLKVGAGNIEVSYDKTAAEPTTAGSLNVKVGSGNTTVLLPETARVTSQFRSGTGSLTNEFAHSDNAKIKISGSSGTGDMLIKKI